MRVTIDHTNKRSGILRTPSVEVTLRVLFNEEEQLIIENRGLGDHVVLERDPDVRQAKKMEPDEFDRWAHKFHLRIRDLITGDPDRYVCETPVGAKSYQQRLTEALKELKAFILDNANLAPPLSFEL